MPYQGMSVNHVFTAFVSQTVFLSLGSLLYFQRLLKPAIDAVFNDFPQFVHNQFYPIFAVRFSERT